MELGPTELGLTLKVIQDAAVSYFTVAAPYLIIALTVGAVIAGVKWGIGLIQERAKGGSN